MYYLMYYKWRLIPLHAPIQTARVQIVQKWQVINNFLTTNELLSSLTFFIFFLFLIKATKAF